MKDTKTTILDVAEHLFAQNGFAGTSVRAIVEEAEVNIASINYHFKSKEGLFLAVIQRRFRQIEKERFRKLESHFEKTSGSPTVEGVVRAFLEPLQQSYDSNDQVPKILIRIFSETPDLKEKIIRPIFGKTRDKFFKAFCKAMPKLSEAEVQWRFQFLLSAMVGLIIFSEETKNIIGLLPGNKSFIEMVIEQTLNGIGETAAK